ncbi:hypothetical protein GMPD_15470 [Geomonas paludis]|uniref:Uncharacterized protein n=1 Tax=Geomonas paludis TaxID=2740185 RepID=A0A6V8MTY1_9BACT|nr:hypothetical protein GMPD_15470 [Geomonas paludis]
MARCPHFDSCLIHDEKATTSPEATDFLRGHFCNDNFTKCRFYTTAAEICEKVPGDAVCLPCGVMLWLMSGRM